MEYTTLNNGVKMPLLGFGVFQIPDHKICQESVENAIAAGYRLIDTAAAYMNEEAVGKAIKNSGIKRDDLFITTKLWTQDASYEGAKKAFDVSLKKLGLDYLDLYLIHQPVGDYYGAYRAMEELYKEGKIRAIGVCNFYPERITDLALHAEIIPAVNQVETHVFRQQEKLRKLEWQIGTKHESWSPLACGEHGIFSNKVLSEIAHSHERNISQIALRFLVQQGIIVIPKSLSREHMRENMEIFDFALTSEEMNAIKVLDEGRSLFGWW